MTPASAAVDVFRATTYELQTGEFTGTSYTLTLKNNLSPDYFTMISGPSADTGTRAANEDYVRVTADPFANFGSSTSANQITLTRNSAPFNWIGALTVVECMSQCSTLGFQLSEVKETSLAAGAANTLQTITDTLSTAHTSRTVPLGGRFGGGLTTTGTDSNAYATTVGAKITKIGSNQIQFDRYGAEARAPAAATFTTFITEWGSDWNVQNVNVVGTNAGAGLDATNEYNTAAISSVVRDNTWVWGAGYASDDGLGDGALGQAVTLGDGVSKLTNETLVAVGAEQAQISPGRNFQVYVLENSLANIDHQFRPAGDPGPGSGFQELSITVSSAQRTETYDNSATDVQTTEGYRIPLFYNTSSGNGQAYSRTGAWGLRHTNSTSINYWRAYAGQNVTGWMQSIDFGNITFSNVSTRQQTFRWRDDTTDLNTSAGWLASEDSNISPQAKNTSLRLRLKAANFGTTPEDSGRTYELQYGSKTGLGSCSSVVSWVGLSDSGIDDFELYNSSHITPDGQNTTAGLLSNGEGFTYVNGEGRESSDTTNTIGPLNNSAYTEVEYALRPTDEAVTGRTYCFRLYDKTADDALDNYNVYPELTIANSAILIDGLGEAGTFNSAVDGGWTNVNFVGDYDTPVVVGTTNSHDGQSALVFESRNVTSTSADMRVCESEGATSNGCDTHGSESVGYMVIDAAVASNIDGIEAGTFTASGEADTNSVNTSYLENFSTTPYVFANVNTVNSTEFPIEVVISSTSVAAFTAGICDHLQGNNDSCDGAHGNETVGWVAIEPGNEPFNEQFDNGTQSIASGSWTGITYSSAFASVPALIVSSQTDTGTQDVEIDEARLVTTTGADIRSCEIDTLDSCDNHAADTVAWHAIDQGKFVDSYSVNLDQDGYRFYNNINSLTPTTPAGDENDAITNVDDGEILRIRMAVQAGESIITTGNFVSKLQYGEGTDCSVIGSWNDLGSPGSGNIWRGYNNASPTDNATIPSSLLDGGVNSLQSYEEANNSAANPNTILSTTRGEWDWVIENNGASDFTSYCFRMVSSSGSVINYSRYPKLTTSTGVPNLAPNSPTNLNQERFSTATISVGEVISETSVVFFGDVSDMNAADILELCIEVQEVGTAFTGTETACGDSFVYSGSAVTASLTLSIFENAKNYHWQARVRDAGGLYSGWISFGGNAENESDFSIDTVNPSTSVFDGTVTGIDIEFNSGQLDQLSANWEQIDGILPNELSGLVLWLDGDDVNGTGTDPSNGSSVSTWADKSGLSNDISGTGVPTFDDSLQAVAFDSTAQPFDSNYDRSGGNSSSQTIISVVRGNGTISNNVWYETTTPRIAPAENGLLGGGTALTGNNMWSNHISNTKIITSEFLSTGTSTAWLDRKQEYQFSETQTFANSQRMVIGDDTTGGNTLEAGEYVHEIIVFNQDLSASDREAIWEKLECKWVLKDCTVTYEYSIGTSPDGTDIKDWTSAGASTSVTANSLNLKTSEVYYFNVRATDVAGNVTVTSSDGQLVAPSLSFSTSSPDISFDSLNLGNSFTDTETTLLTTSTNAYNGYEIRLRATALLEAAVGETIGFFDGGTYASPDSWLSGDRGFGYTSSDPLVNGVNKFNPATCAGGGTGPCYAPYSTLTPGDLVADNNSTVTGTPITNEQFTITHRVTTDANYAAGNYTTVLIFSASAKY
jgi:hypothetical protein